MKEKKKLFTAASIRSLTVTNRAFTARKTPFLDSVCTDLTLQAKFKKLPFIIKRNDELEEVIRILKTPRMGALLVGKSGLGKSSVTELLAYYMAGENVPEEIQDKKLMLVNVGLLMNTSRGGSTKSGIVGLLEEARASGNMVLIFDDMASLVGAEKTSEESAMDGYTILCNYIASYGIKAIGTITEQDQNKYLFGGSSSNRRFEPIKVKELPSLNILQILLQKSYDLESRYKIRVSILAIKKIFELSERYIHHTSFPAKAIQLLEEAAVYTKDKKQKLLTSELVTAMISKKININLTEIKEDESEKLLNLEKHIHKKLIGQDEPVKAVSSALRRARLNLQDEEKTIANFLFLGPTGVGKTELAKSIAETYFGKSDNMIRVDMSEYQEKKSIDRLLGSLENGGMNGFLTNAVRQNPFSLLLLDELEKAHPDLFNIFLQVMDDGRLTDAFGNTVNFKNVILIATSNVGSLEIQEKFKKGHDAEAIKTHLMGGKLLEHFRPEFLNRFDKIAVFHPLEHEHVISITDLLLNKLRQKLLQKRIHFEWSEDFIQKFAKTHYSFEMGARPIKRAIQENIADKIAEKMLTKELKKGGKIVFKADEIIVS